jgi:riboflavin-specific deaminase-like protein
MILTRVTSDHNSTVQHLCVMSEDAVADDRTTMTAAWSSLLAARGDGKAPTPDLPSDEQWLWQLYSPIARGNAIGACVIGQLGQSLDGRTATPTGRSHYVNGREALRHLHRLRALVDAVVVGVGTVLADDPRLTVRLVAGPNPARVVIDPHGRLPDGAKALADDGAPRLVLQATGRSRPAGVIGMTMPARDGWIDPRQIVAALAERGFRRLLIEGGGRTVSAFLAAGALDRLHISVAPLVIGSGPVGLTLAPIDRLEDALRPVVAIHRLGADLLFDCAFS